MSSPRLGPHPSAMPPQPPPMAAQMQPPVPWPGYYVSYAPPSISHAPSGSMSSMSSPPPTPSSALPNTGRSSFHSNAFIPEGHKKVVLKNEDVSRTSLSSNMFSTLQEVQQESNKATKEPPQPRRCILQSRTKQVEKASVSMSVDEAADAKISEDVKEFFSIWNLDEAEVYFTTLPSQHHYRLVNKFVSSAIESKEPDVMLVANLLRQVSSKGLCSSNAFEEGFAPTAEIIEDKAIDALKAWSLFATMVKSVQSNEDHRTRLATKHDKLLGLISDVIRLQESIVAERQSPNV